MDFSHFLIYWRKAYRTRSGRWGIRIGGLIVLLYLLLFSSPGNRIMGSLIELIVQSTLNPSVEIDSFRLRHNKIALSAHDRFANTFSLQGEYSLMTVQMYAYYRLHAPTGGGMNPLKSDLNATGILKGGFVAFEILGEADAFHGTLRYDIQLQRMKFSNLQLSVTDLAYAPLMHEFGYPSKTDTRINAEAALSGFERRDVAGSLRLESATERFTPTPILPDDNETIDLHSLLADENGIVPPFRIHLSADVAIAHSGILEQFVKIPMNGPLNAKATVSGNEKDLRLQIRSDVAQSDSEGLIHFRDLEPDALTFSVRDADVAKLFSLFDLKAPVNAKGTFNAHLNTKGGTLSVDLKNGSTFPAVLKSEYGLSQPPLRFDGNITARIDPDGVRYHGTLRTDLIRMEFDRNATHDSMLRELLNTLKG
ncbi:MAG: hypothetical protein AB7S65_09110 [Sulfuricurvum sp.]